MIVWLNGALVDADKARIDPADRGFTLGDGLFETIAVRSGKILRLDAHRARLVQGCKVLDLENPSADFKSAIDAVLAANRLANAVIRLTLTRGVAPRGLLPIESTSPTLLMTAASLIKPTAPARCIIAGVTRRNEYSPLSRIKSLNYLDNIMARQEAIARGADEAIMLNTAGNVAETAAANLFIVKHERLLTPPVEDGALPGVMRAAVLQAGGGVQKTLTPADLLTSDGIFLTNSLGIRPVVSLDGKPVARIAPAFIEKLEAALTA